MSSANTTITGQIGPGQTITSQLFPNTSSIKFDITANVIEVRWTPAGKATGQIAYIEYSNIATVTYTISAGVATITVST